LDFEGPVDRALESARATMRAAETLAAVECGERVPVIVDVDPRTPLLDAVQGWRARLRTAAITHGEPTVLLPTMRSDPAWVTQLLSLLLGQVLQLHDATRPIHADVELGRGFVAHRVQWSGAPMPDPSLDIPALLAAWSPTPSRHPHITPLDLALVVSLVRRLGGRVQRDDPGEPGAEQAATVIFPVEDVSA
jgi:signal transduction histidine kinase